MSIEKSRQYFLKALNSKTYRDFRFWMDKAEGLCSSKH